MHKWTVLSSLTEHGVVRIKTALEYHLKNDFNKDFINGYDYKFGLIGDASVEYGYWSSVDLFSERVISSFNPTEKAFILTLAVIDNSETLLELIINPLWDLKNIPEMQEQMKKSKKGIFIKDKYCTHSGITREMYEENSKVLTNDASFTSTVLNLESMKQYFNNLDGATDLEFYVVEHRYTEEVQHLPSLTVNDLLNKLNNDGTIITFVLEYTRGGNKQTQTLYLDNNEDDFITNLIIAYLFKNKVCFISKSSDLSSLNIYNMPTVNYAMNGIYNHRNVYLNENRIFYSMYLDENMPYEKAFKHSGFSLNMPHDIILKEDSPSNEKSISTNPLD